MKRWESAAMLAGFILLIASSVLFGNRAVNGVGAALILVPTMFFVIRYVEGRITRSPRAY